MLQFVRIIMTIFLFIQVSREGIENLIAKAIHLLSVQNVMLGYASPVVSKNSMIHIFFTEDTDGQY